MEWCNRKIINDRCDSRHLIHMNKSYPLSSIPNCYCTTVSPKCCIRLAFCKHTALFYLLQTGGGCGRGFHTHPACAGRGTEEVSRRRDGPARGGTGHLPINGTSAAEIPAHNTAAALPQHGEHPAAPGLLYHTQHDTKGKEKNTRTYSVKCKGWYSYRKSYMTCWYKWLQPLKQDFILTELYIILYIWIQSALVRVF